MKPLRWLELLSWVAAFTWGILAAFPASHWYVANELRVDDFQRGTDFGVFFVGGPRREFVGSYSVVMRRAADNEVMAEEDSGAFRYRPGSKRPEPILASWWAPEGAAKMVNVEPGAYVLETCWTIRRPFGGIVPAKTTCIRSNIFRVL